LAQRDRQLVGESTHVNVTAQKSSTALIIVSIWRGRLSQWQWVSLSLLLPHTVFVYLFVCLFVCCVFNSVSDSRQCKQCDALHLQKLHPIHSFAIAIVLVIAACRYRVFNPASHGEESGYQWHLGHYNVQGTVLYMTPMSMPSMVNLTLPPPEGWRVSSTDAAPAPKTVVCVEH
jgi:hypothetical protein